MVGWVNANVDHSKYFENAPKIGDKVKILAKHITLKAKSGVVYICEFENGAIFALDESLVSVSLDIKEV